MAFYRTVAYNVDWPRTCETKNWNMWPCPYCCKIRTDLVYELINHARIDVKISSAHSLMFCVEINVCASANLNCWLNVITEYYCALHGMWPVRNVGLPWQYDRLTSSRSAFALKTTKTFIRNVGKSFSDHKVERCHYYKPILTVLASCLQYI